MLVHWKEEVLQTKQNSDLNRTWRVLLSLCKFMNFVATDWFSLKEDNSNSDWEDIDDKNTAICGQERFIDALPVNLLHYFPSFVFPSQSSCKCLYKTSNLHENFLNVVLSRFPFFKDIVNLGNDIWWNAIKVIVLTSCICNAIPKHGTSHFVEEPTLWAAIHIF